MKPTKNTLPDPSRRALLRGRVQTRPAIRPPWALPEPDFLARCTRCGDCLGACAEGVLVKGDGGFPEVDFFRGACVMCGDCAERCRAFAFQAPPRRAANAWRHRISLNSNCMAMQGVVCRSCGDVCGERAIGFQLRVGGAAVPALDDTACTGCGECLSVCPVQALQVEFFPDQTLQRTVDG